MAFRIRAGELYGSPQGETRAADLARKLLTELVASPRAQEFDQVAHKEACNAFPFSAFNNEAGCGTLEDAVSQLREAIYYADTYWFPRYATETDVTSDGFAIRWQYVDAHEAPDSDRTSFFGLWNFEIVRVDNEKFHLSRRRAAKPLSWIRWSVTRAWRRFRMQ